MFGGAMASATDPIYMTQILGKDYVVWDKSASIRFKRPGKQSLSEVDKVIYIASKAFYKGKKKRDGKNRQTS